MGFIDAIGLKEHLSPRANGLVSMIKNIKICFGIRITKLKNIIRMKNFYHTINYWKRCFTQKLEQY
jgi:hypothetical protein